MRGLNLGKSALILFCASVAHSWGFLHHFSLSRTQSGQLHHFEGTCGLGSGGCLSLAEILIRSVIAVASWTSIKHLAVGRLVGWFSEPGWYHAGSSSFIRVDSLMVVKVRLYFWPVFSILFVSSFRIAALGPRVHGFQVCMKGLVLAWWSVPLGAAASTIMSVIFAHVGWFAVRLRYDFSHIISIASFLVVRSRSLRPPSSIGR